MLAELVVAFVVEALDRRILDGAVHPFDLTVRPRMFWPGRPMLNVGLCAGVFEGMGAEDFSCRHGFLDKRHSRSAGASRSGRP